MRARAIRHEDPPDFAHDGWVASHRDEVVDHANEEGLSQPSDLLLGRKS